MDDRLRQLRAPGMEAIALRFARGRSIDEDRINRFRRANVSDVNALIAWTAKVFAQAR